jgi:acyl-coenzyme A thioesterase PaaI-like protein
MSTEMGTGWGPVSGGGAIPAQPPPWGTKLPWAWDTDSGPEYAVLMQRLRAFLDHLAAAHPTPAQSEQLAGILHDWGEKLSAARIPEHRQVFGRRPDLPSRGQTMLPEYVVHELTDDTVAARVVFGRYYLGGGEAVHGGAIPLVFDELLGALANHGDRMPARTAYLTVNFRAVTPLEKQLTVTGRVERVDGRKAYLVGELRDGEVLCADADALFVAVRRPSDPSTSRLGPSSAPH